MKKEQDRLEKQLSETQAENRRLQDPLQKVGEPHLSSCTGYYSLMCAGQGGGGRATETTSQLREGQGLPSSKCVVLLSALSVVCVGSY